MNICGLLHWPRFMAPPPTNSSSPVCSRSPGCICVLLLSVPHTCHVHMRAHTQTHVHSSRPCTSLLSDSPVQRCCPLEHQAPYTHTGTHTGTQTHRHTHTNLNISSMAGSSYLELSFPVQPGLQGSIDMATTGRGSRSQPRHLPSPHFSPQNFIAGLTQ